MARFLDPTHIPCTPKSYRLPLNNGEILRIPWECTIPWPQFYASVQRAAQDNGVPVPSQDDVQSVICTQLAPGWCTDDATWNPAPVDRRERKCSSCGGW